MANHLFTRIGGVWANNSDLLAGEMADLDAKTVNSISGTGGAYVLTDPLLIGATGGAFIQFDCFFEVDQLAAFTQGIAVDGASSDFANNVTFHDGIVTMGGSGADAFTVNAFATFTSTANFDGSVFFNDAAIFETDVDFNGNASFHGTTVVGDNGSDAFTCNAFAQFFDLAIFNGNAFFNGNTTIGDSSSDTVSIKATSVLHAPMTMADTGAIAQRVVAGDNSTTTYSPLAVHEVVMDDGVLTGSSDWNIDDTGCADGCEILFTNKDTTGHAMTVRKPGGASLAVLYNSTGHPAWGRFVRRAGVWTLTQSGALS